jgi:hypothetical protein
MSAAVRVVLNKLTSTATPAIFDNRVTSVRWAGTAGT